MRPVIVLFGCLALASAAEKATNALSCASCHRAESTGHPSTGMARALQSGQLGDVLRTHPKLTFKQGPFQYTVERKGEQSIYSVSDGQQTISAPVSWAFGLGAAGQTYVLQRNGAWWESRVSYYRDIDGLDLTVGARPDVPRNLDEAFGREQSTRGAVECFNCHSTRALTNGQLTVEALTPGIQCERCHEKTAEHVASFQNTQAAKVMPPSLKPMNAEETSEFCGQCHRTWAKIATEGPHNITNVRFQPYRLANSKCYDTSDTRIRCTTCHNPHATAEQPIALYDAKCNACHSPGAKAGARQCTVAKANCVSCHMPKIEIKEAHNKFTDHWIRVARAI
jgi:hypothetical protein